MDTRVLPGLHILPIFLSPINPYIKPDKKNGQHHECRMGHFQVYELFNIMGNKRTGVCESRIMLLP